MEAVGAYIRVMAEQRKLKIITVSNAAGVASNYIWRLEHGDTESPSFEIIAALVTAVKGSMEDVRQLLLEQADAARAEALAVKRVMSGGLSPEQRAYLDSLSPEQLDAIVSMARKMRE